jgi:hypothetical protein
MTSFELTGEIGIFTPSKIDTMDPVPVTGARAV